MKSEDERFMTMALRHAEAALKEKWIPVGAVFVKNGRLVTHGTKTGEGHILFDHAEHNACYQALWSRECPKNLSGFTVFTTLEPCLMCLSMLITTRVSRIVYGLDDPYGGGSAILSRTELLPARFKEDHPVIEGGVLEESSRKLLKKFFSSTLGKKGHWSDPGNSLVQHVMGCEN